MSDLSFPKIQLSPLGDLYELQEDALYTYEGRSILVPAGYCYDGASIPSPFWLPIGTPFHPRFMPAALPHDQGYERHEQSKEWLDDLFRQVLLASGVSGLKAEVMYQAVRDFGQPRWDRNITPYGGGDS